ncbi:MAG: C4-dicarboxylate ABC transporter substrate-binding protein [Rhodocyclaceae bacterium]|nr:MAG: C4-dicarboxylate ABC transporter substrate-binding protein [Rhodocyclaceae bacterium]
MAERLRRASWRDMVLIGLPSLLVVAAAFWAAAQFVQPAPPKQLILATGGAGGGYQRYAAAYKPLLAEEGITLVERPTSGAMENLALLRDPDSEVDAAFIQGGVVDKREDDDLYSLGAIYQEPVWIFYRPSRFGDKEVPDRLLQLKGMRVAVGASGSGNRHLALELLQLNGLDDRHVTLLEAGGITAAEALQKGRADAAIVVGPVQSAAVWTLLYAPGIKVMNLAQADAYTRRLAYLSHLVLPRGSVDLLRDIPDRDIHLLAPTATLAVKEGTHPALVDLLLQAASETHNGHGLLQKAGDFPKAQAVEFPLSPRAEHFYKSGKPLLQRYLPFWAANLIDRLVVMLIPLIAVLYPVAKMAPSLYGWRIRSRIFKRYGELKFLEAEALAEDSGVQRQALLQRLDAIERDAARIPTPLAFSDMLYTLRGHIEIVRAAILRQDGRQPENKS